MFPVVRDPLSPSISHSPQKNYHLYYPTNRLMRMANAELNCLFVEAQFP